MAEAGIRELRDNLSKYLDRVRSGEQVTITDRGRAIARITPTGQTRTFDRLIESGLITPAESRPRRRPRQRVRSRGSVSDLVAPQRR